MGNSCSHSGSAPMTIGADGGRPVLFDTLMHLSDASSAPTSPRAAADMPEGQDTGQRHCGWFPAIGDQN